MKTVLVLLMAAAWLQAAGLKAGVARVLITPETPIWLTGYASRTHPSDGVIHDLWAKALALEDARGSRVVIVTTDIIGLSRSISDVVAARVQKEYGLERARLVLNSIHTHTGPVIRDNLSIMFDLDAENSRRVAEYGNKLTASLVSVVGAAIGNLAPASLAYGHGEAGFAMNRREPTAKGIRLGVNAAGPTDKDVPVVRVTAADGKLLAVLFGYACHNTTLTGEFYKISGDYAGFAQIEVEKAHPGTTAMFLMLCGADQNPYPRSSLELAEKHGRTLAAEVDRVLSGKLKPVDPRIRAAFRMTDLTFAPQTRETFEKRLNDPNPIRARHAKAMIEAMDERLPFQKMSYPVQAVSFGKELALVALGGEVVVDYALRAKKEYGADGLIVAGYSNEVMAYIPSLAVLKGGGYEVDDSMIYYGKPGRFNEDVEEDVFRAIRQVLARAGRQPLR